MPDVSKTSGARRSRSTRTRLAVTQGSRQPTVRTKRTTREVAAGGRETSLLLQETGRATRSFFGSVLSLSGQVIQQQAQKNTKREIQRISTETRKRPDEAREAVRTGDYSSFSGSEWLLNEDAVREHFQKQVARQSAADDFDTEIRFQLATLDPDIDAESYVGEYLDGQLKDMPDIFADEYSAFMVEAARPVISKHRESVVDSQTAKGMAQSEAAIRAGIQNRMVSPTAQAMQGMRNDLFGSLPVPSPVAKDLADERFDSILLDMASQGDPIALKMLVVNDDARDGLSVATRRPEDYRKAKDAIGRRLEAEQAEVAETALNSIHHQIDLAKAGQGASITEMWAPLMAYRETYGENDRVRSLRDEILRGIESTGTTRGEINRIMSGKSTTLGDTDWASFAPSIFDGTAAGAYAAETGQSAELVQQQLLIRAAHRGVGKKAKDQFSRDILIANDPETFQRAMLNLDIMDANSPQGLTANHVDQDALDFYTYATYAAGANGDRFGLRQLYLENRGTAGSSEGYLGRQKDADGKTNGSAVVDAVAAEAFNQIADSRDLGSIVGFGGTSWDEQSPEVRAEFRDATNRAAYMLHGQSATHEQIGALASRIMSNRVVVNVDEAGNEVFGLQSRSGSIIGRDGFVSLAPTYTNEDMAQAVEDVRNYPGIEEVFGGFGGIENDRLTALGYGLSVRGMDNGTPVDRILIPGDKVLLPENPIPQGSLFFESEERADGSVLLTVPSEDSGQIKLSEEISMIFVPEVQGWVARYIPRGHRREIDEVFNQGRSPAAPRGYAAPSSPEAASAISQEKARAFDGARQSGMIRESKNVNPDDLQAATDQGLLMTKEKGYTADNLHMPAGTKLEQRSRDDLLKFQGRYRYATDSATGQLVGAGKRVKGDILVGPGLHASDPGAAKMLERVGADPKKVKRGDEILSPSQIDDLADLMVRRSREWIQKSLGSNWRQHEVEALMMLGNASKWTDSGPQLIPPHVRRAAKEADRAAVADFISTMASDARNPETQLLIEHAARLFRGHTDG